MLARLGAFDQPAGADSGFDDTDPDRLGDDRLELIFACIHPALDRAAQVALTLRALGGLTTDEIADAFFVERSTMQQRLVRAKRKIRQAGIPFCVPPPHMLPQRLDAVAAVVYLIFTTGYAPPRGARALRTDLCESAIAIGDLLVDLMPQHGQTHALCALMRFHHARRATRADDDGHIVLLADQDRRRWDRAHIDRASASLKAALALPSCGLTLEAYIAAAHAHAPSFEQTDWDAIVQAYDALIDIHDTPVARCNRAVALAMRGDVDAACSEVAALAREPAMIHNRYYHVACAEIVARAGDIEGARQSYSRAMQCAGDRDRYVIARRLARLDQRPPALTTPAERR